MTIKQAEKRWEDLINGDESVDKAARVLQNQLEWIQTMIEDSDYKGVAEMGRVKEAMKQCFLKLKPIVGRILDNE